MRIIHEALTFDDVLLEPAYSEVLPREVKLKTQLTRSLSLNIPIISSAMDTVTEARLAITLAQEGGIGIIHKNMSPKDQARQVQQVKKFESGVIHDPITVTPDTTIRDVIALTRSKNISGVPVVEGENLVGIVTHRDLRFETQRDAPVSAVMTPKERLVTVREGADKDHVLGLLHKHRIEKVLVVDKDKGFKLRGMITVKDIQKAHDYPLACKDERGALRVGAAVGTGVDTDERVALLVEAGADVIIVDTAHGHSRNVLERVRAIKRAYPDLQLIAGNIVTAEAAKALDRCGRRRRQGRHRARLDLHDAHRRRRGHSADHGRRHGRRSARGLGRAVHLRRRHPLLGRHREGHRGRRALDDDRRPVRGHRGIAGRGRALPRPVVQVVSRHGLASVPWRNGTAPPTATSRTRPRSSRSSCPRASRAACRTRAASSRSCSS